MHHRRLEQPVVTQATDSAMQARGGLKIRAATVLIAICAVVQAAEHSVGHFPLT
jgi:hypothetical protein